MSDLTDRHHSLPGRYVLHGCGVVAGDDLTYHENGHVLVDGDRIAGVGPGPGPTDVERIDLTGRVLVPGFLNGHTHVGDSALKELGFGLPPGTNLLWQPDGLRFRHMFELTRERRVAAMRDAALEMIAGGTVLFSDFREYGAGGIRELREACEGLPITPMIFGRLARNPAFTPEEFLDNTAAMPADVRAEVEEILDVGDGYSPVWANELTDPALAEAARITRASGKRLATHACESLLYRSLSLQRTGRTDAERVVRHLQPDFVVHMTSATHDDLDVVIDAGLPIIMCPRSQEGLGTGIPPVAEALRKGAVLGFGTDNVMLTTPDVLAEAHYYAFAARGRTGDTAIVDPHQLLRSLTIDTATALGVADDFGSLVSGKLAHIVCFDFRRPSLKNSTNPIATIVTRAATADIEATIHAGRVASGALPVDGAIAAD